MGDQVSYLVKVEAWAAAIFHAIRRNPDPSRVEIRDAVWSEYVDKDRKPTADEWMAIENRVRQERAAEREREVAELLRFDPLGEIGLLRPELGETAIPAIERLQEAVISFQEVANHCESGNEIHPPWLAVNEALKRLAMFRSSETSPAMEDDLPLMELCILDSLRAEGKKTIGAKLAKLAGYPENGRWRETLSRMKKEGKIANDGDRKGYYVP